MREAKISFYYLITISLITDKTDIYFIFFTFYSVICSDLLSISSIGMFCTLLNVTLDEMQIFHSMTPKLWPTTVGFYLWPSYKNSSADYCPAKRISCSALYFKKISECLDSGEEGKEYSSGNGKWKLKAKGWFLSYLLLFL